MNSVSGAQAAFPVGSPVMPRIPPFAPIAEMGLLPIVTKWEPTAPTVVEGDCTTAESVRLYGDGSGYHQSDQRLARASWSVVRMRTAGDDSDAARQPEAAMRGYVTGWFRTVPTGELCAVAHALERVALRMVYVGDCKFVLEGCIHGVPQSLRSSGSVNADLWRRIGQLLDDKGEHVDFVKAKAHRSLGAAAMEGERGVMDWHGNCAADEHCKSLIRQEAAADPRVGQQLRAAQLYEAVANFLGYTAGWTLQRHPAAFSRKNKHARIALDGAAAEAAVGQHVTAPRKGGGRVCVACKLSCRSEKGLVSLRRRPCKGSFVQQAHPSHSMGKSCGVDFCFRCGAFAAGKLRTLRDECPGRPRTATQANIRRRLISGLPPTASALHAEVARGAAEEEAIARANGNNDTGDGVMGGSAVSIAASRDEAALTHACPSHDRQLS